MASADCIYRPPIIGPFGQKIMMGFFLTKKVETVLGPESLGTTQMLWEEIT
jgi:hypothetical protein